MNILITLRRILKSGFINFWRNGFVSLSSILVMTVTLFVIGSVVFLSAMLSSTLTAIKEKVDVNVYFTTEAEEDEVMGVKRSLEALPEVQSISYVSREQALENFKQRHQDDALTLQSLEELEGNPLGAVLNVQAHDASQYESIATFLQEGDFLSNETGDSIIDKVNYYDNKAAIDRLANIIDSSERLGAALTIILIVMSVLITLNTIRLAIYTSKDEIAVMRLVGAGNMYVRGPFVVTGILYGVVSAFLILTLFFPITYWLGPKSERFFVGVNIFEYYVNHFEEVFLIVVGAGIVIGAFASWLAVRRYLKT